MLLYIVCGIAAALAVASWLADFITARRYRKAHRLETPYKLPQAERVLGVGMLNWMLRGYAERTTLQAHFERAKELNNTTASLVIMGAQIITTADPENIKALLATQFKDFELGERNEALAPFLGKGIFTTDGAHWERSRALIRPSFTKAQVAELPTAEEHFQNLISKIPTDGTTVDLQMLFANFTLDNSTDFLFGQSIGFQLSPPGSEAEKFSKAFDRAQEHLNIRVLVGPLRRIFWKRGFADDCRLVHSFVDRYITSLPKYQELYVMSQGKTPSQVPSNRYNLMSELANATNDRLELRNELLNVLLAARDTTASLLSSTFFMLSRHPAVWRRLHKEVAQLDGEIPTYDKLRDMVYAKAIVSEILRLFPPVPINVRYANKNTSLPRGGGPDGSLPIFVAKGTTIHYCIWTMHRMRAIYGPDSELFRPERWLNAENEKPLRPGWGFLPFNGGPRICIGQQKALTEATYVIVRMVQEFSRIESRDTRPWAERMGLVVNNYNGTKVALFK